MLGLPCPKCGRRNAVGDRPSCMYCGASLSGEGPSLPVTGEEADFDPEAVDISAADHVKSFLRSWPGGVAFFALLLLAAVVFYKLALEHYAPYLRSSPPKDRYAGVPDKPGWKVKEEAEAALQAIDGLLQAYGREHGRLPEALGPDLALLEPHGDVIEALSSLDGRRIGGYRLEASPTGKGQVYTLEARVPDTDRTPIAFRGTFFFETEEP